jgi:hypothetical protein
MNVTDAEHIAGLLCQTWPTPELSPDGLEILMYGLMDSDLSRAQAEYAVRTLIQTARWRPTVAELNETAKPTAPSTPLPYHRPYLVPALPAAPADPDTIAGHIAAWRTALRRDQA